MRSTHPRLPTACGAALALTLACNGSPDPDPEPPPAPEPSSEICDTISAQAECFEAGCAFFTSAFTLRPAPDPGCRRAESFGVCLHSPSPEGPAQLTSYVRERDGERQTLQLNFDVELAGWQRCGRTPVPPDCDCDGAPDQ